MAESTRIPLTVALPPPPRSDKELGAWAARLTATLTQTLRRLSTAIALSSTTSTTSSSSGSGLAGATVNVEGQARTAVFDQRAARVLDEILLLLIEIRDRLPKDPGR